jgi:hypothetical protein
MIMAFFGIVIMPHSTALDIGRHCASLPDLDTRTVAEILGYDEHGLCSLCGSIPPIPFSPKSAACLHHLFESLH